MGSYAPHIFCHFSIDCLFACSLDSNLHFYVNLLLMDTKKPADPSGRAGARWERGGLSQGWSGRGCAGNGRQH